jgi:hypothetical protein
MQKSLPEVKFCPTKELILLFLVFARIEHHYVDRLVIHLLTVIFSLFCSLIRALFDWFTAMDKSKCS